MDIKAINIVREEPSPSHVRLNVEVSKEAVGQLMKEVEREFRKQAQVPGFRKGKIPRAMLYSRFGEQLEEEAKKRLLQDSLRAAIESEELRPETSPQVDNQEQLKVDPKGEFVYAAEFDITPEFELPDYTNLEVNTEKEEVKGEDVDEFIDRLMEQRTSYEKADKKAEAGDLLKSTYNGKIQGEDIGEPGETAKYFLAAEDSWIALKEPEMMPGITRKLTGAEAGSEHEVEVEFPDDFHEKSLAGKTVDYKIQVSEVHEPKKPDFDDETAKQLGAEDTADARNKIKENLDSQRERQYSESAREEVVKKLVSRVDFSLPPQVLANETRNMFSQIHQQRQRQGASEEELRSSQEELYKEAEEQARARLKRRYVLRKVAEAEEIKATPEEVQGMIKSLSQYHQMQEKELVQRLQESGAIGDLIESIVENKASSMLLEFAKGTGDEKADSESAKENEAD